MHIWLAMESNYGTTAFKKRKQNYNIILERKNGKKSCTRSFLMSVLCCSEMSTKRMCYTLLFYCHILLRLQSKHQFLPAQFRVVPNEPLHAQVLCTHDHFCEHLMLLPTWMFFSFNAMGTASKFWPIFIHFQRFFSQGRMC